MGDIECNNPENRAELEEWIKNDYRNFSFGGIMTFQGTNEKWLFVDQFEMFNWLVKQADPKKFKQVTIFFHKLYFDAHFFWEPILATGARHVKLIHQRRIMDNEWGVFFQGGLGSRILWIKIKLAGRCLIIFRCSKQILPYSVHQLGKMVNIPKLEDFDYAKKRHFNSVEEIPVKDVQYLHNDLLIVITALQDQNIRKLFGNTIHSMTVSSAIFKEMCRFVKAKEDKLGLNVKTLISFQWNDSDVSFDELRSGYRGGICVAHWLRVGKNFSNAWKSDKVSAYPSYMTKWLPSYRNTKYCYRKRGDVCIHYVKVWFPLALLKKEFPCGALNKDRMFNKQNDDTDDFDELFPRDLLENKRQMCWIWEEELEEIKKWYDWQDEIDILKTYHFLGECPEGYLISDFIKQMFLEKQKIKRLIKKKPDDRLLQNQYNVCKARLNSLYGQLGMNDTVTRKFLVSVNNQRITKWSRLQGDGEFVWKSEQIYDERIRKDLAKASYITMKQRVSMLRVIRVNREIFIYADTDSIITTKKPVLPKGERWGNKLGDWEPAERIELFKAVSPKQYISISDKVETKAGGAMVDEIGDYFVKKLQRHAVECVISNYTQENSKSFKKRQQVWYKWGSALVNLETKAKRVWRCKCGKANE